MMDLVYILGNGSKWSNNELRYSLRSVEKNFKYGKVFVIGEKPEWLENVIHIPAIDNFSNKIQNAIAKYLIASKDIRISDDFILMNDDFFFLRPIEAIPYYSRGTSKKVMDEHRTKAGYYFDAIKKTKQRLLKEGFEEKDIMDFEVHAPIVFNKTNLREVIERIKDGSVCLLRTYYCNLMFLPPVLVKDFKVTNVGHFNKELLADREFMSIGDTILASDGFREWLQNKFSEVSKYENDEGAGIKAQPGISQEYLSYHASEAFNYQGRQFRKGELIDIRTMRTLKHVERMKHLWVLK